MEQQPGTRQPKRDRHREPRKADSAPLLDLTGVEHAEAIALLEQAEVVGHQLVPTGTNYTFAALMSMGVRGSFLAIYKPQRGENPLWDFPGGTLHRREQAAYLAGRQLGWPRIPATIVRDGPFGVGSFQLHVPTPRRWDFSELQEQHRDELMEIALFDLLVNNADRKAGHCLLGLDGKVWSIDHGLTFNVAPKLRTVLWDYCGEPVPRRLLDGLESLRDDAARRESLRSLLEPELDQTEVDAFFLRMEGILRRKKFPRLDPQRNIPWPLV